MGEHKFDGRAAFAATGGAARWVAVAPCAGCAKAKGELEVAVALAGGAAPGGSTLARVAGAVGAANDELAASEAAYVSDLKVLRDAFEGPLRLEMGTKQRRVEQVGVLEVLDRLFEALDVVLALAETRVLPAFEAAKNSGAWADCFEALAPELCDAYGAYVVAYASVSAWIPNLQPDFNVSVFERFGPDSFAVLRELDNSNRFVQKSAESTSI